MYLDMLVALCKLYKTKCHQGNIVIRGYTYIFHKIKSAWPMQTMGPYIQHLSATLNPIAV